MPTNQQINNINIDKYDQFNCTHRKRYNIINYPFQEKLYKNEEFNSLEIIYLLNHKGKIIK